MAGPGFVNLHMSDRWYADSLEAARAADFAWGAGSPQHPERQLVEFVSANPTGPITVAAGRHAAYGDSLARLLETLPDEEWARAGRHPSLGTMSIEFLARRVGEHAEEHAAQITAAARGA